MSKKEQRVKRVRGKDGDVKFVQSCVAPTVENYLQSLESITGSAETLRIISFYLSGQEYAFEVEDAVEVLKPGVITEVPRVPAHILGVLSVRGEMVSVMDLKKRLNISTNGVSKRLARIVVAGGEEERTGFLVDGMGGVKELSLVSVEPVDDMGGLLKGVVAAKSGNGIKLLNVEKLLNPDG